MTVLTFPSSPIIGQQYNAPNEIQYVFDGVKWIVETVASTSAAVTNAVQDRVAPMFVNGPNTGITFAYNAATNVMNAAVTAINGNQLVNGVRSLTLESNGNITTPAFTIPNAVGTSGQVLKWPGSGTTLVWSADSSIAISDFGRGFTNTLDSGKITTNKLYNRPDNLALNNHFELSVDNGGVVHLPDQSVINGATLKTVPGNYAGITAGPASPAGKDEDSWVWVDNDGATIATKYSTDNYQWKFDNTGNLILPNGQSIGSGSLDGIKMTTDRGTVLFGNSPECVPTLLTHFHIMKDDPANVDLFLGDDNNYVKLPGSGETAYGVEIGTNVGSAYTWRFGTGGDLTLPEGGDILDSNGDSVLGGGSYTPDDSDLWNSPTVNTVQAALDELAARVTALQNYEIDGGNANTPELGELIIDGNNGA